MKAIAAAGLLGLAAALAAPAAAQVIPGGSICGDTQLDPCYVEDYSQTDNTALILGDEEQELMPGLAGGLDIGQTLSGDLEQQVSGKGGLPLMIDDLYFYPHYWPGYANANYAQTLQPGSPEADSSLVLGTLWGALNAGANQQVSQEIEAERMYKLEQENGEAIGNLEALEVGNEIALFNGQEEIKARNAANGQLNALLVAESNRENEKAQGQLESLAVAGADVPNDFTNDANPPEPKLPE